MDPDLLQLQQEVLQLAELTMRATTPSRVLVRKFDRPLNSEQLWQQVQSKLSTIVDELFRSSSRNSNRNADNSTSSSSSSSSNEDGSSSGGSSRRSRSRTGRNRRSSSRSSKGSQRPLLLMLLLLSVEPLKLYLSG